MRIIDSHKSVCPSVRPSVAVIIVASKGGDASQSDIVRVARSYVCMRARVGMYAVYCARCVGRAGRVVL